MGGSRVEARSADLGLMQWVSAALPHTHGDSFFSGLMYPLSGLDHLLAVLAIGAAIAAVGGTLMLS